MKSNRRSKLVFGAVLAAVVSLSGVRGVAADAKAEALDLVLEPLAAPQESVSSGLGQSGFGDLFSDSLFDDLGGFFGLLRFGGQSGYASATGGSASSRPGDASGFLPGRFGSTGGNGRDGGRFGSTGGSGRDGGRFGSTGGNGR